MMTFKIFLIFFFSFLSVSYSKIITLGGTVTEIVYGLGAGDKIVAVDLSSLNPLEARNLPQVGYIRNVSLEGILSLEPTAVIASDSLGPKSVIGRLKKAGIKLKIIKSPQSVEETCNAINEISSFLSLESKGKQLVDEIRINYSQLNITNNRASAIFLMYNPGISGTFNAAGNHTKANSIIEISGANNLAKGIHNGYKNLNIEGMLKLNPEVIFVGIPENTKLDKNHFLKLLSNDSILCELSAVRNNRVYFLPLSKTLSFGHEVIDTIQYLNDCLYGNYLKDENEI